MKKAICIIFAIVLAGVAICLFNLKNKETDPAVQKSSESPVLESPALEYSCQPKEEFSSDILTDIRKAQQMLEKKDAGFQIHEKSVKGKKGKKWEVKDFRVLLAVQHVNKQIVIVSIDPKTKESDPAEYTIDWNRSNGVNTNFTVVRPSGCLVLAIKRVVNDEENKDLFREVVYTPYTTEIDCETLRDAGLSYLKKVIEMARADLRQVSSQAYPELSVAETVQAELALVLAIIEHIDPNRLKKEPIDQLINEVLVTIGANQSMAYRYSVSKANARGLFQFIPGTYAKIREQYQDAGLKEDFIQGMNNHLNAAKASLLLFDSDLSYLNQRVNLQKDKMSLGRYLASAYNCGAKRTAREIRSHKGFWERKVPLETKLYLKKFSATWKIMSGT